MDFLILRTFLELVFISLIISSSHILKHIDCTVIEEVMQEQQKKKIAQKRLTSKLFQQDSRSLSKYAIRSLLSCCFLDQQVKYSSPYLKSQETKSCYTDSNFLGHRVYSLLLLLQAGTLYILTPRWSALPIYSLILAGMSDLQALQRPFDAFLTEFEV